MSKNVIGMIAGVLLALVLYSCGSAPAPSMQTQEESGIESSEPTMDLTEKITELEDGLSAVRFEGDSGFDDFLAQGGAASDGEVAEHLTGLVAQNISFGDLIFGCSTISVQNTNSGYVALREKRETFANKLRKRKGV